jgi:hypothetical protein
MGPAEYQYDPKLGLRNSRVKGSRRPVTGVDLKSGYF